MWLLASGGELYYNCWVYILFETLH